MASTKTKIRWNRIAASVLFLIVFDAALKFTFIAIDDLQSVDEISVKSKTLDSASRIDSAVLTESFSDALVLLICLGMTVMAPTESSLSAESVAHRTRPPPDHLGAG